MSAWAKTNGGVLNQGDLLRGLTIPTVRESFPAKDAHGNVPIDVIESDIIILSQSCDLELGKLPNVIAAQVFSVVEFEAKNPDYKTKGKWTHVARGRVESLHLLTCPDAPDDRDRTLVIDFKLITTLPVGYVSRFAEACGDRWRLQPPYLEALSHALGHFFSRVAIDENFKI